MKNPDGIEEYIEEVGGIYYIHDMQAIPYNHWKRDCEWIVLLFDKQKSVSFIQVCALTAREACEIAIYKFFCNLEDF